jgi:Cu/Ag efflux pump CusA
MVGGMISAPLLSRFVIPTAYYLLRRRRLDARLGGSAVGS